MHSLSEERNLKHVHYSCLVLTYMSLNTYDISFCVAPSYYWIVTLVPVYNIYIVVPV